MIKRRFRRFAFVTLGALASACGPPEVLEPRLRSPNLGDDATFAPRAREERRAGGEAAAGELAARVHPSVRAAQSLVPVARAGVGVAVTPADPQIKLGREVAGDMVANDHWAAVLQLPIPNPIVMVPTVRAAQAAVPAAEAGVALAARKSRRDAELAWLKLANALARRDLASRASELGRRRVAFARTQVESGYGEPMDLHRIEADGLETEERRAEAESSIAVADADLQKALGGVRLDPSLAPIGALSLHCEKPPEIPEGTLEARLMRHPALEAIQATHVEAEQLVRAAVGSAVPWVAYVQAGVDTLVPASGDSAATRQSLRFGASIDVPVFQWFGARVTQAKSIRDSQRERYGAVAASLASDYKTEAVRWASAFASVDRLEKVVLPSAEAVLKSAADAVQAKRFPPTALFDAEARKLGAEGRFIDALFACAEARVTTTYVIGTLP